MSETRTFLDGLIGFVGPQGPEGPQGPPGPSGGGSVPPISRVRYVDKLTTVAAENQTGTIAAPFANLSDAVYSLQLLADETFGAGNNFTVLAFPGDYSAEGIMWDPAQYGIGLRIAAAVPGGHESGGVSLPNIEGRSSSGQLSLSGVFAFGVSGGWSELRANGSGIAGTLTCGGAAHFVDCNFSEPALTVGGRLFIRGGTVEVSSNPVLVGGDTALIESCNVTDLDALTFSGSAGVLKVDGMVDYLLTASGGCTLTNGTKTVMG